MQVKTKFVCYSLTFFLRPSLSRSVAAAGLPSRCLRPPFIPTTVPTCGPGWKQPWLSGATPSLPFSQPYCSPSSSINLSTKIQPNVLHQLITYYQSIYQVTIKLNFHHSTSSKLTNSPCTHSPFHYYCPSSSKLHPVITNIILSS